MSEPDDLSEVMSPEDMADVEAAMIEQAVEHETAEMKPNVIELELKIKVDLALQLVNAFQAANSGSSSVLDLLLLMTFNELIMDSVGKMLEEGGLL